MKDKKEKIMLKQLKEVVIDCIARCVFVYINCKDNVSKDIVEQVYNHINSAWGLIEKEIKRIESCDDES